MLSIRKHRQRFIGSLSLSQHFINQWPYIQWHLKSQWNMVLLCWMNRPQLLISAFLCWWTFGFFPGFSLGSVLGRSPGTLEYPAQFPRLLGGYQSLGQVLNSPDCWGSPWASDQPLQGEGWGLVLDAHACLNFYQERVGKTDQGKNILRSRPAASESLLKSGQPDEIRFWGHFLDTRARVILCGGDPLWWGRTCEYCGMFSLQDAGSTCPHRHTHLRNQCVTRCGQMPSGGRVTSGWEPPL